MTQPLDRSCTLPALGELDTGTGEFWPGKVFDMPKNRQNVSAFERNRSYLNVDGDSFLDFSFASGCDIDSDSRSVVAADFDRDGRTDLLVGSVGGGPLRLFLNRFPTTHRSVRIELQASALNRNAIGARVTAHCGGHRMVRDIFPANGCLGQAPAELMLGVGDAETIDRLTVRWPSGNVSEYREVKTDGVVTLSEDDAVPQYRHLTDSSVGHSLKSRL